MDLICFRGHLHHGFYILNKQLVLYVEDDKSDIEEEGSDEEKDDDNGGFNPITIRMVTNYFASGIEGDPEHLVLTRCLVESSVELVMVRHLDHLEDFEFFTLD